MKFFFAISDSVCMEMVRKALSTVTRVECELEMKVYSIEVPLPVNKRGKSYLSSAL